MMLPKKQQGAALFIALVVLLVITLLALSSTREATLETRITGNFTAQQKTTNNAEAGLREGESQMTSPVKPLEPACADTYCFRNETPQYAQDFTEVESEEEGASNTLLYLSYAPVADDDGAYAHWYAIPAPAGAEEGAAENPEYGNMMLGIGTFRYEVNTRAGNTANGQETRLRSTTAKVFN